MGKGLQIVSGFVTAPGATFTAWTIPSGDSLQIRSANINSKVWLLGAWGFNQVIGTLRIRSPRLHDNVQGIRMRVFPALTAPMVPDLGGRGLKQFLIPQDVLIVEQTGSAVGGQIETGSFLVWYDDIPGIAGRFIGPDDVDKFGINHMAQEVAVTTGVAGGYSGGVAINSAFDNFKANTDYALLGGMVDVRKGSVGITGVDSGNLRVGFPAEPTLRAQTANWFERLSICFGIPMIPVFNSANKFNITIDATDNQVGGAFVVTLFMVELQAGSVPGATQPGPPR